MEIVHRGNYWKPIISPFVLCRQNYTKSTEKATAILLGRQGRMIISPSYKESMGLVSDMATRSERKHVYDAARFESRLFLKKKKKKTRGKTTWRTSLESPHQSALSTAWHDMTPKTTGRENKWPIKAILRARDISVNATEGLPVPRKVETEQMSRQCAIRGF